MTVDTSRPAVEALIAEASKVPLGSSYWSIVHHLSRSLAALLDERDRLENSLSARDVELQQDALRIRDLEAENRQLLVNGEPHRRSNRKWNALKARAERAEAERDEIAADLADETKRADENYDDVHKWRSKARRLTAKLDSVKLYADDRAFHARGHLNTVNSGRIADDLRAILADTDETGEKP